ncbi:probable phospholipid-transporting ATPase IA isoform X5 [Ischnura elegans]|nr:probable phospholipid-transporting ATPase IA isoform X5 [Ischnura elegans]
MTTVASEVVAAAGGQTRAAKRASWCALTAVKRRVVEGVRRPLERLRRAKVGGELVSEGGDESSTGGAVGLGERKVWKRRRKDEDEEEGEEDDRTSGITEEGEGGGGGGDGSGDQHRVIFLGRPQPYRFCSNYITTAKYSVYSFIPSFLFEQFRRYSNCFFLFIALLQQIPDVSPTGRYTTLVPLIFILSVSAIKEIVEDVKRHRADGEINHRELEVLRDGHWQWVQWLDVVVGDVVKVHNDNFFPADLIILSSSEPQALCYIETANLDGETNLKIRQGVSETALLLETKDLDQFTATIECDLPNRHLYEFTGVLRRSGKPIVPLGPDQILLRGAKLQNTNWVFGVVVYTGHETKLMMNSTSAPLKRSTVDRITNHQILWLFFILIVLCLASAIFNVFWTQSHMSNVWYLGVDDLFSVNFGYNLLTFIILFNNLIPISLQVSLEVVRYIQATFINMDIDMYHKESNTPAMARTSNLNEELGQVKYIFSDKTGTLTRNVMDFKKCSIAAQIYTLEDNDPTQGPIIESLRHNDQAAPFIREFLTLMAVCHTVIPESGGKEDGPLTYYAASPDERALVNGARKFGYVLKTRTPEIVEVDALGEKKLFEVLHILEFTSSRKRMSVVVRLPDGRIRLYCKGADTVIYERLAPAGGGPGAWGGPGPGTLGEAGGISVEESQHIKDMTLKHLEHFASDGLRTLCCAVADVSDEFYEEWKNTYYKASTSIHYRERKIEDAANLIENNLVILGATAIEDKLQEGVADTIFALLKADIHLWVLTGDKQETAINIGYSCKLINTDTTLFLLNADSLDSTRDAIIKHMAELKEMREMRAETEVAVIIDGKTLKYALGCEIRKDFLDLCICCRVVICCRVSPIQKAEVVEYVTIHTKTVTLAIGDGANDVAMIQKAHVGIGISGEEGLQACCASDYSIAQFRFLTKLLFVHGAWNYSRMCKLILYSFYKNICLYVIELWFAIYSGWSGQILFERWSIGLYNVLFTAAPPLAMGLFDRLCSAETMMKYPSLYKTTQSSQFFNVRVFWVWIGNALIHSVLLYWLPFLALQKDVIWGNGREGGYLLLGNIVYTYVVVTVCLKAGLITNAWTWLTHLAIWGSIVAWFLFILIYSNFWPTIPLGAVMLGMDRMIFSSPVFWLGLILIPFSSLLLDIFVKVIYNTAFKSTTERVRESEIRKTDPEKVILKEPRHKRICIFPRGTWGSDSVRSDSSLQYQSSQTR